MLVSIGNLMKHWKFQKDWLTCHEVMTMESFPKSSCRIVDTCLLFSRREYVLLNNVNDVQGIYVTLTLADKFGCLNRKGTRPILLEY